MIQHDPSLSELSEAPRARRLSATAIFIGFAIGNGASFAVLYLSALALFWVLALQGAQPHDLYPRAYQSHAYLAFAHTAGFATTAIGGYWCARLAPRGGVLNAALAGILLSVFVFAQMMIPYDRTVIPGWSRALSLLLPVPAFICGALLRRSRA